MRWKLMILLATSVVAGGLVAVLAAADTPVAAAPPQQPPQSAQPAQPVEVMNLSEVIIDEYKDIDPSYDPYIYDFGRHDLSAYDEITIYLVGDCVFAAPYDCAATEKLTRKASVEVRMEMGHPNTIHDADDPNRREWRTIHWGPTAPTFGPIATETLEMSYPGLVEFRVHWDRGPVHLIVVGRRS